jgi:hypothetical protein
MLKCSSSTYFVSLSFMIFLSSISTIFNENSYLIQYSHAIDSGSVVKNASSPNIENYFAFNYRKVGGFAGMDNIISYDSKTNELSQYSTVGIHNFKEQLLYTDVKNLKEIIQNEGFFKAEKYYRPGEAQDVFNYTLTVVFGDNSKTVTWTDSSLGVPSGLSEIVKAIENVLPNKKIP